MDYTELWKIEMIKSLYSSPNFLTGVKDLSDKVVNNSIKLKDLGVEPEVLINNISYPLPITERVDSDRSIDLDKFQTEATRVTDDELAQISYDKIASINEDHKRAIEKKVYARAIYTIAPDQQTAKMPILKATGPDNGLGFARLLPDDIVRLRAEFRAMGVEDDADLRMVLNGQHWVDLMLADQSFREQYKNVQSGNLLPMYGFNMTQYSNNPYYYLDNGIWKRKSFGAIIGNTDRRASIGFYMPRIVRAKGSTTPYFSKPEPLNQESLMNYRHYHLAFRKASDGVAAIVSDTYEPVG